MTLAREVSPRLIALDVTLPDQAGWRLLTALKSHPGTKSIPVVTMCGREGAGSGMAIGLADLLLKPLKVDDVRGLM